MNLRPNVDYDIDYLQGRLLLSEPLSATANDNLLVRTSGLSGDQSFLVVRYEYTPGLDKLDAGRRRRSGQLLVKRSHEARPDGQLQRGRRRQQPWRRRPDFAEKRQFLVQGAGGPQPGSPLHRRCSPMMADSDSRALTITSFTNAKAGAYRADMSVGLSDFFKGHDGRFQFYKQRLDAGYSAPGQMTIKDTEQYGGTFKMPVTKPPELDGQGRSEDRGPGARDAGDGIGSDL